MKKSCLQVGNGISSFSRHCFGVIYANAILAAILPGIVSVESFVSEIIFEETNPAISIESFAAEIILLE